MKTALVILPEGFEEIEALVVVDILRRGGITCTLAAHHDNKFVTGKTCVQVVADELFRHAGKESYDLLVIPGGPGIRHLRKDRTVIDYVKKHAASGRLLGAICAAPALLKDAGLLNGREYTAHFSMAGELPDLIENRKVVQDGNIVTSRGAGTAVDFALHLLKELTTENTAEEVSQSICYSGAVTASGRR